MSYRSILATASAAALLSLSAIPAHAVFFHTTSGSIDGSLCVGLDCVSSESFGFDTLRIKENNVRLHYVDTSSSASFPTTDWRIVINDSANGGGEYYGIQDADTSRTIARFDADAPANSIRVRSSGNVGLNEDNPVVQLHVTDGNTPTLRLEQDGSNGFNPQTWDLAGNETNFFIRDVSNGSALPFRIEPGAATDALYIEDTDDIGIGTNNPTASLHVRRTGSNSGTILLEGEGGATKLTIDENSTTNASRGLLELINKGNVFLAMTNTDGITWNLQNNSADFRLTNSVGAGIELQLTQNGDLTVTGDINSGGVTNVPDYVFAPDYELMPLNEVQAFITENSHLPRIPSADDVLANGLNMTDMQMALLEKVEELTLYTLQQQALIETHQQSIETLKEMLADK